MTIKTETNKIEKLVETEPKMPTFYWKQFTLNAIKQNGFTQTLQKFGQSLMQALEA